MTGVAPSVSAIMAPPRARDNPLTRSWAGLVGVGFLAAMLLACLATLPWTLGSPASTGDRELPRYKAGDPKLNRLPPSWVPIGEREAPRLNAMVDPKIRDEIASRHALSAEAVVAATAGPAAEALRDHWPTRTHPLTTLLGTDFLGRSLLVRVLAGGGISLAIGLAAAALSVTIGTLYGAIAAYAGGKTDAVMMRIVDVLYGLPYILLVVLLAVASDALLDEYISRSGARAAWVTEQARLVAVERGQPGTRQAAEQLLAADPALKATLEETARATPALQPREITEGTRSLYDIIILLVAIGGISWLTMARVIRGQVLSLKAQPFMEAARAMGASPIRQFIRHLLPNLVGPIVVYATLTVPQAILQESFLSFLGIGVKPPLPSWGNLAAEGLTELNTYRSHWWLLLFPCILLGSTLLALNFVGEGLREALDPKRSSGKR
jgi:oligopeptide transport system permease protein